LSQKKQTFIDQAKIFVKAGDGGDGHVGFYRAKFIPKGGPDGGDGGRGGSVVLVGSTHKSTLYDFQFKKHFRAGRGEPGGRAQRTGADGKDLELPVPLGTIVTDAETGKPLGEVTTVGEQLIVEEGGKGGLGNMHFKSSTNQAPRKATPGVKRDGLWIRLELKLLADVGIVGLPNAGKSTLLSALSQARPKIADYPFTTLSPSLGVVHQDGGNWTMADTPGLIEGAHEGAGLGIQFLRHIQRTRVLLYLVAADPNDPKRPWRDFQTTRHEIECYDRSLGDRKFLVAMNKADLITDLELDDLLQPFHRKGIVPLVISAKKKTGLTELAKELYAKL
jgi:GTPase